jgi:cobalt-zinc-cadmium efflux system membrane fusion protein
MISQFKPAAGDMGRVIAMLVVMIVATLGTTACSEEKQPPKQEQKQTADARPRVAAIDPTAAKAAGISVAVAGSADIRETITLYGTVKPNAEREQSLRARYPGTVRTITKRVGETVRRGEILLTIESSESLQVYPIASPIAGTVLERHANPGETVDSQTTLMRVADLSTVWVEFAVFARDLGHVRAEMPVRISASDGDFLTDARLTYVSPSGDAGNQSVVARADMDNATGRWVAGQFVTGEVAVDEFRAHVSVLPAALQALNGKDVIFVRTANGFEPREVKVGRRSRHAIEIVNGLQPGETYVSVNSYLVKADLLKGEAEEE